MSGGRDGDALAGRLGALRWALLQNTDDPIANLTLIKMAAVGNSSWLCFLSVRKLAEFVGCDPRTIQRKLRHLERRGFIELDVSVRCRTSGYRLFPERDDEA